MLASRTADQREAAADGRLTLAQAGYRDEARVSDAACLTPQDGRLWLVDDCIGSGMERVVIFGRGAAGKSTLARQLGKLTGLPVTELDKLFWQSRLAPLPRAEWSALQEQLAQKERWILDGDLGPHDIVEVRLRAADTIILLDFGLVRCAWRALRRARERADFWLWVLAYRRDSIPHLRAMIAEHAPDATVHILRSPSAVKQFLSTLARQFGTTGDAGPPNVR